MGSVWMDDLRMPCFPPLWGQARTDVLIIGGTSLAVYPAAGLIDYFQGDKLVVINKSATPRDSHADLLVQGPIGEVFHSIQNP